GVAGPVIRDRCEATNLPWTIDARELERAHRLPRVALLNDFDAIALGLDELTADDVRALQDRPRDPTRPAAVIGAGTGLGEAIVVPSGGALPIVLPSEGGHT